MGEDADGGGGGAAGGLELRQLQVTIRHGDRSAIHELPNADEKRWKCQPFSEEIRSKWEDVSRYGMYGINYSGFGGIRARRGLGEGGAVYD